MKKLPVVALYAHDGMGLGHLRRCSRLAEYLQGSVAATIITGMREVGWMASPSVEYFKLPSVDATSETRAAKLGRAPWRIMRRNELVRVRRALIETLFAELEPAAIVVDYLPFGQSDELTGILQSFVGRKYLLLRGLIDFDDLPMYGGSASERIAGSYDRIVVAADPRIVDVCKEYNFVESAIERTIYVGYMAPRRPAQMDREPTGDGAAAIKVVCTAGGGTAAGEMIVAWREIARLVPRIDFAFFLGPRNSDSPTNFSGNCTVTSWSPDLPQVLRDADIVMCTGGYNTVMEAASGGARIIVWPNQVGGSDEQRTHALRLSKYYPIDFVASREALADAFANAVRHCIQEPRPRFPLAMDGCDAMKQLVLDDLGI